MYLKKSTILVVMLMLCGLALQNAQAQAVPITFGLNQPTKMITAPDNLLLVSEAGGNMPNTGRISIVDQATGARRTLIDGLPSGIAGEGESSGPTALLLHGRTLYVAIATGDAVFRTGPGTELPNPNPASQLFDSILELTLPGGFQEITTGYTLTMSNQTTLANGGMVRLGSGRKQLVIRVVANLPDYVAEPRPGNPNNVRASNLFGLAMFQKHLYVADASLNLVHQVSIGNGSYSTFVTFAPKPNPLPFGPPFVEAVPDSIHRVGNQLLVTYLTGFPFPPGVAEVRSVNLINKSQATLIGNLTSAIDSLHVGSEEDLEIEGSFYTLEFSANMLMNLPGRLKFYSTPDAAPVTVVADLISPTSMARNDETGDIFVTEIFTGRIMRVTTSSVSDDSLLK